MCLADKVAASPAAVWVKRAERIWSLPDSSNFALDLREANARYVLLEDVSRVCRSISDEWPDLLAPANPRLRAPMPSFWLEWTNSSCRQEVGALIKSDIDGRSGRLRLFWNTAAGAEVAQADVLFDLDNPITFNREGRFAFRLAEPPPTVSFLRPHLALLFDECWEEYFRGSPLGTEGLPGTAQICWQRLLPDVIDTFAFFALLGTHVPFEKRPIERDRLNFARAKRGKPSLLDHVQLTIGKPQIATNSHEGAVSSGRRNPRLHAVRGHLVRRGDGVFWRVAHMRGNTHARNNTSNVKIVRMHRET